MKTFLTEKILWMLHWIVRKKTLTKRNFFHSLSHCTKKKYIFNPEAIQNAFQVKEINDYTFNSFPSVIFRSFDDSSLLKKERIWRKHESDEGVKKQSWTKDWKASGAAVIHRLKSYSQLSHVRIAQASKLHRRVFCTPTRTARICIAK